MLKRGDVLSWPSLLLCLLAGAFLLALVLPRSALAGTVTLETPANGARFEARAYADVTIDFSWSGTCSGANAKSGLSLYAENNFLEYSTTVNGASGSVTVTLPLFGPPAGLTIGQHWKVDIGCDGDSAHSATSYFTVVGAAPNVKKRLFDSGVKGNIKAAGLISAGTTVLSCAGLIGALLVPGAQVALPVLTPLCYGSLIATYSAVILKAIDPPDPNWGEVALPKHLALPSPRLGTSFCRRVGQAHCPAAKAAARGSIHALARVDSIDEALAQAADRYTTAQSSHSGLKTFGATIQGAAALVLEGELASAAKTLVRREHRWSGFLRRAHVHLRLSARQVREVRKRLGKKHLLSKTLVHRLVSEHLALSSSDLRREIRTQLAHVTGPLDLGKLLTKTPPTKALKADSHTETILQLSNLFAAAPPEDFPNPLKIGSELNQIAAADTRSDFRSAVNAFISTVKTGHGRYGAFLALAARGLHWPG
jgi:hypothetical protein